MTKYPELKNLAIICKVLDELKIPYYITGGFAVSIYGRPRFTADIDIVIKIADKQISDFVRNFQKIMPKGYIDSDLIMAALQRYSEFNIIDPESGLKVDFFITKNSSFEKECFKNAINQEMGYKIKIISPEDLIISKLLWYRDSQSTRQLEDIASVMDIQEDLGMAYIEHWIKELKLEEEWGDCGALRARNEKLQNG